LDEPALRQRNPKYHERKTLTGVDEEAACLGIVPHTNIGEVRHTLVSILSMDERDEEEERLSY
jgi:hypothetical protein